MKHIFLSSIPKRIEAFLLDLLFVVLLGIVAYFPFSVAVNANPGFTEVISQYEELFDESKLYTTDESGNYILFTSSKEELNYADYSSKIYYYYTTYLKESVSSEDANLYTTYWFNVHVLHLDDVLEIYTDDVSYDETYFTYQNDKNKMALILSTTSFATSYNETLSSETKTNLLTFFKARYEEAVETFNDLDTVKDLYNKSIIYSFIAPIAGLSLSLLILCLLVPLINQDGKTIGKMILKMVVLTKDGYTLPRYKTLIRFLVLYFVEIGLSILTLGGMMLISYTMMNFAKKHRCLHDFIAGSCVANAKKSTWFVSASAEKIYIKENANRHPSLLKGE